MGSTYADLEAAPAVLLVAFEPEDESPIVFLRLRKASASGTRVFSLGSGASRGLSKMNGTLIPAMPGDEASALADLPAEIREALAEPGAVIMMGERVASAPGACAAAVALAQETGAVLSWVPRRAGERGALDAGALAGLLPGGRPIDDPLARQQSAGAWGVDPSSLPQRGLSGDRGNPYFHCVRACPPRGLVVGVESADYRTISAPRSTVSTSSSYLSRIIIRP